MLSNIWKRLDNISGCNYFFAPMATMCWPSGRLRHIIISNKTTTPHHYTPPGMITIRAVLAVFFIQLYFRSRRWGMGVLAPGSRMRDPPLSAPHRRVGEFSNARVCSPSKVVSKVLESFDQKTIQTKKCSIWNFLSQTIFPAQIFFLLKKNVNWKTGIYPGKPQRTFQPPSKFWPNKFFNPTKNFQSQRYFQSHKKISTQNIFQL